MAQLLSFYLSFLTLFALALAGKVPVTEYDVIVVGGGPAGLSATSALCRVARKVIVFDSQQYRNARTRNMHDVIGSDGAKPDDFRTAARNQINKYGTAVVKNTNITEITAIKSEEGYTWFVARDSAGLPYTARRVILATGVTDLLPSTPGVLDAFGKGMYWCPWCDGYEHREQSIGVIGPLSNALSATLEIYNLNKDVIVMTNGTDTAEERALISKKSASWQDQFAAYNISIVNTTISSIKRLKDQDGRTVSLNNPSGSDSQFHISNDDAVDVLDDNSGPNGKHKDLFLVKFADGLSVERAAFIIYIPTKQTSRLPEQLKLNMTGSKIKVDTKMETSHPGIYAVGDNNDDGSTNVPHAMYSGKRAAVVAHIALAREESAASISKRSEFSVVGKVREKLVMRQVGNELENLWDGIQRKK